MYIRMNENLVGGGGVWVEIAPICLCVYGWFQIKMGEWTDQQGHILLTIILVMKIQQ